MKDIRTLYLTARNSGRQTDIAAYTEAINELLESNPNGYISNLEYIISSSIGLNTWDTFVTEYGFPLVCYNDIIACFEKCIDKCDTRDKDASKYKEAKEKLESFYDSHKHCVSMFESYSSDIMKDGKSYGDHINKTYVETYYGSNGKGVQNRKLVSGMIENFGEYAIPDILITAESISENAVNTALSFIEKNDELSSPVFYQYVTEAAKDVIDDHNYYVVSMESKSIQSMVDNISKRNQRLMRESMLMGEDNVSPKYTMEDVQLIRDLIEYKESQVVSGHCDIDSTQKEIYSLYESIDSIIDENGDFDPEFIYESSTKEQKAALKDMSSRLTTICKEVKRRVSREINGAVKKYNKSNDLKSFEKIWMPYVHIVLGADKYRGKPLRGYKLDNALKDELSIDKKYLQKICIYAIFRVETGRQLTADQKKESRDIYGKALLDVLRPMLRNGSLSIAKPDNCYMSYTTYITTWTIPIYIRKSLIMDDIPASLFESYDQSSIEGCIVESLIKDVQNFNEEDADAIVPMLPGAFDEAKWVVNTRNKKTGAIPSYMSQNHDINYGEDDVEIKGNGNPSEEDLKRPSADESDDETSKSDDILDPEPDEQAAASDDAKQQAINNYYYYTYNNSLNKNSHSFNRDNSSRDNHSRIDNSINYTHRDDHRKDDHSSTEKNDDHSTGKRVDPDDDSSHLNESSDIIYKSQQFSKALKNAKETSKTYDEIMSKYFKYLYEKDLNDIKLESVPDVITLKIGNIEFAFPTKVGYAYKEDGRTRVESFSEVPCAVYLYQNIKDQIQSGDLYGIKDRLTQVIRVSYKSIEQDLINNGLSLSDDLDENLRTFKFKPVKVYFNQLGHLGFEFDTILDEEHGIGISVWPDNTITIHDANTDTFESVNIINHSDVIIEAKDVSDYMDNKPQSDSPVRDIAMDLDRKMQTANQQVKSGVQKVQNVGRAVAKPVNRAKDWVTKTLWDWKDKDENAIKERLADPKTRSNLFSAIRTAIKAGSLAKAGLLFNPIFMFLEVTKAVGKNKNEYRLRNEMIGELQTEIKIIDEKIKDADNKGDNGAKYKLMRFKNELQKKLLRVGGGPRGSWAKVI